MKTIIGIQNAEIVLCLILKRVLSMESLKIRVLSSNTDKFIDIRLLYVEIPIDLIRYLVCPQTYSHTIMCKVCLTASNTLFGADAFVRLNH